MAPDTQPSAGLRRLLEAKLDTYEKLEVVVVLFRRPDREASLGELALELQVGDDVLRRIAVRSRMRSPSARRRTTGMAEAVYILCALTSVLCAGLLARSYGRARTRLLMWSTLCFVGLAINNVLLLVDLMIVPDVDLSGLRSSVALISVALLVIGLTWEDT